MRDVGIHFGEGVLMRYLDWEFLEILRRGIKEEDDPS